LDTTISAFHAVLFALVCINVHTIVHIIIIIALFATSTTNSKEAKKEEKEN